MPTETAATEPGERLREPEAVERAPGRDVGAADRRAARATVGLQDVAVEPDGPLAERLEVDDAAQRAADQPLDLDRAAALLAARRLALGALAGRRRQERVLGRHPAAAGPVEPARNTVGTDAVQSTCVFPCDQSTSRAAARGSRIRSRAQLVGRRPP